MKTPGERIKDLREDKFITIRQLAKELRISESQLSRIEKSETVTVSSDILVNAAKYFGVSSDYILGLSPARENTMQFADLRLSEGACVRLAKREVNGDILSKLIEHKDFGSYIRSVNAYFNDTFVEGVSMRNDILHFGASFLRDNATTMSYPDAVSGKANDILQARISAHEIELTDIRNMTMKILKETKEKIDTEKSQPSNQNSKSIGESLTVKLREIADETMRMEKSEEEKLDYIMDKTLEAVCAQTGANMNLIKLLKPVYKKIIRSVGSAEADPKD